MNYQEKAVSVLIQGLAVGWYNYSSSQCPEKNLQTAVFHVQVNTGPRSKQCKSHSVRNLSPDLNWAAERPRPWSWWSSPSVLEPGWAAVQHWGRGASVSLAVACRGVASAGAATDVPLGAWHKCFHLHGDMYCQCTLIACRQPLRWLFIKCCKLDPCSVRNDSFCMFSPQCVFIISLHCIPVFSEKDE